MTYREAFSTVQGIVGHYAPDLVETAVRRLIKAATIRFASETSANVVLHEIAADGSRDYAMPQVRIGRIWRVEHQVNNIVRRVEGVEHSEFDRQYGDITTSGTDIAIYARIGRTLRVAPLASSGTIRIYHSPVPVLADRDTPEGSTETTTSAGSTTSLIASTISHGVIGQGSASDSDYFDGCVLQIDSGTQNGERSFVTGYVESTGTFTVSPAFSGVIGSGVTFHIEDTLEVPDEFAPACVDFAAGLSAALDPKAARLTDRLLGSFDHGLAIAAGRPFGSGPDIGHRLRDRSESVSALRFGRR